MQTSLTNHEEHCFVWKCSKLDPFIWENIGNGTKLLLSCLSERAKASTTPDLAQVTMETRSPIKRQQFSWQPHLKKLALLRRLSTVDDRDPWGNSVLRMTEWVFFYVNNQVSLLHVISLHLASRSPHKMQRKPKCRGIWQYTQNSATSLKSPAFESSGTFYTS